MNAKALLAGLALAFLVYLASVKIAEGERGPRPEPWAGAETKNWPQIVLTNEAEFRDPDLDVVVALCRNRHAQRRDDGENGGAVLRDRHQRSHFRALGQLQQLAVSLVVKQDDGLRSGDRDDPADRAITSGSWRQALVGNEL